MGGAIGKKEPQVPMNYQYQNAPWDAQLYERGAGPAFYVTGSKGQKVFKQPGKETMERIKFRGVERRTPSLILPVMEGYGGPPIYPGESLGPAPDLPQDYLYAPPIPSTFRSNRSKSGSKRKRSKSSAKKNMKEKSIVIKLNS